MQVTEGPFKSDVDYPTKTLLVTFVQGIVVMYKTFNVLNPMKSVN